MDTPRVTPKSFFLWLGAMIAFYWSVIAGILLIFDYINYAFPNALAYNPNPYESGISNYMASVIVMLPVFLVLMRFIRADEARTPALRQLWVRRWALILILFVSGAAIAGDVITLLTTFLNGQDVTTAFLLKVVVVLLIAAGVFLHFISDVRGYWDRFPSRRRSVSVGVAVLALVVIVSGFFIVGTPQQARLARFDNDKVTDLQNIQSRVVSYWQAKRAVPASLADVENAINFGPLPVDPQSGQSYEYRPTGPLSFELCANFSAASRPNQVVTDLPVAAPFGKQDNWAHPAGHACFVRTIDPSFYPPPKQQ